MNLHRNFNDMNWRIELIIGDAPVALAAFGFAT
jgi:hypothetical protein